MANKIAVVLSKSRDAHSGQLLLEQKLLDVVSLRPDVELTVIPHLYDLTPDGPAIDAIRAMPSDLFVLCWLYPRAAYWTLDAHGIRGRLGPMSSSPPDDADQPAEPAESAPQRTIWCFDLRTHDQPEPFLNEIARIAGGPPEAFAEQAAGTGVPRPREIVEAVRPRWYPVIDSSRCTNCLECLNFCLFGVYSLGPDNTILIEQPDACRPGCPACSRICPQGAIMFPQHADPGVAGDPVASLQGMKLDLSQLLSGVDPAQLAAWERQHALQGRQSPASRSGQNSSADPEDAAPPEDHLDRLVDEVDELDL